MNITKESNDYSLGKARRAGFRDGQDCALLDRLKKNPYNRGTELAEWELYEEAWKDGFDQESQYFIH